MKKNLSAEIVGVHNFAGQPVVKMLLSDGNEEQVHKNSPNLNSLRIGMKGTAVWLSEDRGYGFVPKRKPESLKRVAVLFALAFGLSAQASTLVVKLTCDTQMARPADQRSFLCALDHELLLLKLVHKKPKPGQEALYQSMIETWVMSAAQTKTKMLVYTDIPWLTLAQHPVGFYWSSVSGGYLHVENDGMHEQPDEEKRIRAAVTQAFGGVK